MASQQLLETDNGSIAYSVCGEGLPVLLLHGLFGSKENWNTVARRLSSFFTVYSLDCRNHGASFHASGHSYHEMADDLDSFTESLGLEHFFLCGHSMGGKTALVFTLRFPDKVRGLIVEDIDPFFNDPGFQWIIDALLSVDLDTIRRRKDAEDQLLPRVSDRRIAMLLLANLRRGENGYFWRINLPVLAEELHNIWIDVSGTRPDAGAGVAAEGLAGYSGPVLFITGDTTGTNGRLRENRDSLLSLFPRCHIVTIPGTGHWVHGENPQLFVQEIRSFLETAGGISE